MNKIYKFSTSTCGPCRMVKPIWDKIIANNTFDSIEFKEIIIDKDNNANSYIKQFNIKSVPTFIITTPSNDILDQFSGMISEQKLLEKINKWNY